MSCTCHAAVIHRSASCAYNKEERDLFLSAIAPHCHQYSSVRGVRVKRGPDRSYGRGQPSWAVVAQARKGLRSVAASLSGAWGLAARSRFIHSRRLRLG